MTSSNVKLREINPLVKFKSEISVNLLSNNRLIRLSARLQDMLTDKISVLDELFVSSINSASQQIGQHESQSVSQPLSHSIMLLFTPSVSFRQSGR